MKRPGDTVYRDLCLSVVALSLSVATGSPALAQGPPGGLGVQVLNTPNVKVANTPLPVSITNAPATPVQLKLNGLFEAGNVNMVAFPGAPRTYTVPEGSSLLVKYISCAAFLDPAQKIHIELVADFDFGGSAGPGSLVDLILETPIFQFTSGAPIPRRTANQPMHAYLGISTPGGPTIGNILSLQAQRSANTGTGGVECTVAGELFD